MKKRRKKATVDLSVQISKMKVKMNHPCEFLVSSCSASGVKGSTTHHQVETERLGKCVGAVSAEGVNDVEPAGSQDYNLRVRVNRLGNCSALDVLMAVPIQNPP